ncbi:MAG: hypothetical protein IPL49_03000 [Saprospirales bacterium]|nr:hypothetical protein [Saprospirales bacterium]
MRNIIFFCITDEKTIGQGIDHGRIAVGPVDSTEAVADFTEPETREKIRCRAESFDRTPDIIVSPVISSDIIFWLIKGGIKPIGVSMYSSRIPTCRVWPTEEKWNRRRKTKGKEARVFIIGCFHGKERL